MKSNIVNGIVLLVMSLFLSCSEGERESLDLSGDVQITSFSANGTEAVIDEEKKQIKLVMPIGTDLSNLSPTVVTSVGASVSPSSGSVQDMNGTPVTYMVTNGNLYAKYTVTAEIVSAKITKFNIGRYIGSIDQQSMTIKLVMPLDVDVTALTPAIEFTVGAEISPSADASVDFSSPVEYTLTYMGGTFTYTVSIDRRDDRLVAFVGTAKTVNDIADLDEKHAAEWLLGNIQNSSYVCFDDIFSGAVNLNQFALVWWQLDGTGKELPAVAKDATVVNAFKAYHQQGGSLYLSAWAVRYLSFLNIPADGREPNNTWGDGNTAFQIGDDWGLSIKGQESHPAFAGLQTAPGNASRVYLLGKGCMSEAHNAIWNFEWGDYANDMPKWSVATGAVSLASFHWDDNHAVRSVMMEYPAVENGKGGVVCIGVESYDWYNESNSIENVYKSNLERLTKNIINYLID